MTAASSSPASADFPSFDHVRLTAPGAIKRWLCLGWSDLRAAGWVSPAYGAIFAAGGFVITFGLVLAGMPYLITPMIGGFLLIGPLLALGLYDISDRHEKGLAASFGHALLAFRRNRFHILTAGLVLMLVVMIWARLSAVLFALFFPYQSMTLASFLAQIVTFDGIVFTVMMMALGFVFATAIFVTHMVSLPMMLDRKVDIFSAAIWSVMAVVRNPVTSVRWAATIALVVGAGMAAGFVGLVVALPLIGHASWHAYREMIGLDRV
ncbi:MAG: DUF2189 domain-containing protein [Alphaproteobacteria bacterium]|nr:DUF2189 domain-containing protein [Alphaproteobacteria bacterium]